ncbi:divergent polysaccharide deacetylase family protein [Alteromonas sp. BL110]|uniref:divergent polysaccharide deacetylase family protein n=1 Tax=Alteromonas sp. BL110 TaxID=1714845 RepID=UPI000E4CE8C4|nr:divergent polysaccharide deacetylase family protein [Alteromonas sp. BL110]AXT38143.1 divergent polysaccharide deacetylase family protein [Alteromonas sp. BL110]RKM80887.1 divergent polysaccharide deacetylase family protein [Alteromonas sp. BL110]
MLLRLLMPCTIFVLCGLISLQVNAKSDIIIILDDLGYRPSDVAAFSLPKEITFSILPQTPLASDIAHRAEQEGRAVMLHMPMQAQNGKNMGPLGLTTDMFAGAITHNLRKAMKSVPNAVGVNNHMGSAFTGQQESMEALLKEVKRQGLFFVDSRTTVLTKGEEIAERLGVPSTSRQVFLDHKLEPAFLLKQFNHMKRIAKKNGHVVVIGHPHPETVDFLNTHLPALEKEGFTLTSVADYFSHAPKVAKQFGKARNQTAQLTGGGVNKSSAELREQSTFVGSAVAQSTLPKDATEPSTAAPNE